MGTRAVSDEERQSRDVLNLGFKYKCFSKEPYCFPENRMCHFQLLLHNLVIELSHQPEGAIRVCSTSTTGGISARSLAFASPDPLVPFFSFLCAPAFELYGLPQWTCFPLASSWVWPMGALAGVRGWKDRTWGSPELPAPALSGSSAVTLCPGSHYLPLMPPGLGWPWNLLL